MSDGTYNYQYDAEGNRTKRVEIATGKVTEYIWDYRERLTSVVFKDAGGTVTKTIAYTYDVNDRRIGKQIDGVVAERYVYDGQNIALVFDGAENQTDRYLYGTGVDQVLADEKANGAVLWALSDNQGTVRDLVDSAGTIQNHIVYDSYGNVTTQTNQVVDFRFGYTGREFDPETGQYYYRARYYDTGVGRFISSDPIGFAAGDANLYRYTGNNPVNRLDPSGEDWLDLLNQADQFAAGFGDTVSFGATSQIRAGLYGETATRNHSGGFFNAGQVAGVVASTAVGFGAAGQAARGGGWAIGAVQGYTTVGDAVGAYQSTKHLVEGCFTPADLLGFAPVVGYLGGRALRGLDNIPTSHACFVGGTKVSTPEGYKFIENLTIGDVVISVDPESGEVANHQIKHLFNRQVPVILYLRVEEVTIACSPEHPFWVPGTGWQQARKLQPGSPLLTKNGFTLNIDSIERREGSYTVYNIEVEGLHTYCVSELSILVHNKTVSTRTPVFVDVELNYKPGWSPAELQDADEMVTELDKLANQGLLIGKTDKAGRLPRTPGNATKKYEKAFDVKVLDDYSADHVHPIAFGGADDVSNMALRFKSVNQSLGPQLSSQAKKETAKILGRSSPKHMNTDIHVQSVTIK